MESIHIESVEEIDRETGQIAVALVLVTEDERCISAARIYVYEDASIYVGAIETEPDRQHRGVATRLLLHVIDELKVTGVRAGTVSFEAEGLFAKLERMRPDVAFDID